MFYRSLMADLNEWSGSENRKPLVLRGARQVGKTSLVNEFGKNFENYLYLNLEHEQYAQLFRRDIAADQLVTLIFAVLNKQRREGKTLLFIDEIQNSPEAIAKLRYFYEELRDIHVISAGSLLENVIDIHKSFPVGRVNYMAMRPCSFSEFLGATDNKGLAEILSQPELTPSLHDMLETQFKLYSIIGGMPEAIASYAKHHDIVRLGDIYESLLQGYRDDVEKYATTKKELELVRFLLTVGWLKAGEIITLGNFGGSQYRAKDVAEGFRLLNKAMIAELVYPTSQTGLPIIGETSRSPKLLLMDTGLVNYAAGIQSEALLNANPFDTWRGHISEQIVGQELLTLNNKVSATRNFWMRNENGSSAEVDFLYQHGMSVIPIEVKSGHNTHLRSLHSFMNRSDEEIAVRVWNQPLSIDNAVTQTGKQFTLINLPFYLVGQLPRVIDLVRAGELTGSRG